MKYEKFSQIRNAAAMIIWLLVASPLAADDECVQIGTQKQLLVDNHIIADMKNVTRELGEVTKANDGKPIIVADKPWENADLFRLGSVIRDGDRFRMWYLMNDDLMGYAESEDGVHWTKPNLGTHECQGSRENNATDSMGFGCFLDTHEKDPEHKYKSAYGHPTKIMACLAHSPDGFHWTPYNDGQPVTSRAADTMNQLLWDDSAQVYRLYTRTDYGRGRYGGTLDEDRGTRDMTNPDIKSDPTAWTTVREWHFENEGRWEFKRRQVYSLNGWLYKGIHFGLLWCYEWPGALGEGPYDLHKRHERDILNFCILTTRASEMWNTEWVYAEKPLVPRGPDGAFDKDWVQPAQNIITWQDRHWIYYAGSKERHDIYRIREKETRWQCAIGLAWLRLDGFVSLCAGSDPGTVVTKPFRLEGNTLRANVDARQGEFWVEILDADGKPIAGFTEQEAVRQRDVDDLQIKAAWNGGSDLASIKGEIVRLKFGVTNAKLCAFQVEPSQP
ncbi:MAG: hypothetical protein ABIH23_23120 [bacterium]